MNRRAAGVAPPDLRVAPWAALMSDATHGRLTVTARPVAGPLACLPPTRAQCSKRKSPGDARSPPQQSLPLRTTFWGLKLTFRFVKRPSRPPTT